MFMSIFSTSNITEMSHPRGRSLGLAVLFFIAFFLLFFGRHILSWKNTPLLISSPLLFSLHWVYVHLVHNWGWAIVVLTIILNLFLAPMRIKAMRSMAKMKRLQPQMDAIKEKYKSYKLTDPRRQEMHAELMELQREEGISMFSGCLPLLIQWPLLIAFYRMLAHAAELHQAHWLWLPDLSAPDPYYILPILFVLSMLLTQLFSPTPGMDRKQQQTMAIVMALMFGAMAWKYSAALALYWTCSNILSLLFQFAANSRKGKLQE